MSELHISKHQKKCPFLSAFSPRCWDPPLPLHQEISADINFEWSLSINSKGIWLRHVHAKACIVDCERVACVWGAIWLIMRVLHAENFVLLGCSVRRCGCCVWTHKGCVRVFINRQWSVWNIHTCYMCQDVWRIVHVCLRARDMQVLLLRVYTEINFVWSISLCIVVCVCVGCIVCAYVHKQHVS